MRKAAILTLMLLILCSGGVCVATSNMYEEHDQVNFTEKVIYGDREAVNGLSVEFATTYKYHLLWDTVHTLKENGETETNTEYGFSAFSDFDREVETVYEGVRMMTNPSYQAECFAEQDGFREEGIGRAYQELFDKTEPGQESKMEIVLSDYLEYYPLEVELSFPKNGIHLSMTEAEEVLESYGTKDAGKTALMLYEYFKIPVLEGETYEISIRKNSEGKMVGHGGGSLNGDSYYMNTISHTTDNACYFTFDTRTHEGKIVDTSHIPDGYGIYCLSYKMEDIYNDGDPIAVIDYENFELFYPLNPEIRIAGIVTNEDQSRLILHVIEDEVYSIMVIDIETREMVQRLEISEWNDEYTGLHLYDEGDFMASAMTLYGQKLAVVSLEDNGQYKLEFVCDIQVEELEELSWLNYWRAAVDFDGEKLVMTGQLLDDEYGTREDTANFYLAVYEADGLVYYGEYRSSLSTGTDSISYNYHCRGTDYEPLKVKWVE